MRLGYWVGMGLGVVMVGAFALTSEAPLRAAAPQGAVAAQVATQVRQAATAPVEPVVAPTHRFAPPSVRRAVGRAQLPSHGATFLSMVAGDAAVGAPPVAAVREEGKLRLVQPGDTLDGAVVASIAADALTLRTGPNTVVLPRAR